MTLDFEKQKLVEELKRIKPKRVLVQLAEGIKQNSNEIADIIEPLGIEVIFSGETSWGACSVAVHEAKELNCDLIVHFGHAKFIDVDFPILYIEVKDILNLEPLLKKSLKELKEFHTIGLSYSIQHRHEIENIVKFYEKNRKKVILSKKSGHAAYEGHIVGCEYSGLKLIEKEVDAFVIIGNNFHSMGAALSVAKPVMLLDVYNDEVKNVEKLREKILKQRAISIQKLRDAKNVGIIIEVKPGQKFGNPKYLVTKLKEQGKNPIVITMSEVTTDKIMNFYNIDAFIELACPRIAIDDFAKYPKPILTFKEALVALNVKTWEEILKIGIV
ncbi:diphthamide biosynthesis enzyme Dph2 [Candidatus Pacearchaeota archaeon]|nr:diphthamide biosynthesis enzyme Dph2 [Candidatus Pacearchaeota archaeon]